MLAEGVERQEHLDQFLNTAGRRGCSCRHNAVQDALGIGAHQWIGQDVRRGQVAGVKDEAGELVIEAEGRSEQSVERLA